jgi:hypothetical protein
MEETTNEHKRQQINRIKKILNTLYTISNRPKQPVKANLEKAFEITKTNAFVWNWNDYTDEEQFVKRWSDLLFYKISTTEEKNISFNVKDFLDIINSISENLSIETFQTDFYKFALNQIVDNIQCYSYAFSQFFKTKFQVLNEVKYTFKAFLCEILKSNFDEICSFVDDFLYLLDDEDTLNCLKNNIAGFKESILKDKNELIKLLERHVEYVESMLPSTLDGLNIKFDQNEKCQKLNNYRCVRSRLQTISKKLEKDYFKKLIENLSSSIQANELFLNEEDFTMIKETIDTEVDPLILAELVYFKNVPIFNKVTITNHYSDFIANTLNDKEFRILFERILLSKPVLEFFDFEQREYFKDEKFDKGYYFAINNMALLWDSIKLIPMPENIGGATTDMLRIFINIIPKKVYNCKIKKFEDDIEKKVLFC